MAAWWKGKVAFDRHERYLDLFSPEQIKNKHDRAYAQNLLASVGHVRKRLLYYRIARAFFFVLLYASVALPFLADYPFLAQYGRTLVGLAGFLGAAILGLLILFVTGIIAIHIKDLDLLTSHIVAVYVKNDVFPPKMSSSFL